MARIAKRKKSKPAYSLGKNMFKTERTLLFHGDMFDWLKLLPDNSIDSCIVDGPYGLEFMGEDWDSDFGAGIEENAKSAGGYGKDQPTNVNAYAAARVRHGSKLWTSRPAKDRARAEGRNRATDGTLPVYTGGELYQRWNESWAREVLRVLKPGGHILAFGGTRTFHRLVCGLEDAGFEVRDLIQWMYGTGFPKSHKFQTGMTRERAADWEGWGTALKPGHEPICMARKPLSEPTIAQNVLKWGTGGINIGACEIERAEGDVPGWHKSGADGTKGYKGTSTFRQRQLSAGEIQERRGEKGRWPANVIMDGEAGLLVGKERRFFYCPKPSQSERDLGLTEFEEQEWVQFQTANGTSKKASSISEGRKTKKRNIHPTVKPVCLMRYLIRLITPPGGTVLDNMLGSGSTGVAVMLEDGFRLVGGERVDTQERPFFSIAKARIYHAEDSAKVRKAVCRVRIPRKTRRLRTPGNRV